MRKAEFVIDREVLKAYLNKKCARANALIGVEGDLAEYWSNHFCGLLNELCVAADDGKLVEEFLYDLFEDELGDMDDDE